MKIKITLIILSISILSCNKPKDERNIYFTSKDIVIPVKNDEYELSFLSNVLTVNDTTYVYRKSRYSTSIYVYNWQEKKRIDKIDFQEYGPNSISNFAQGAVLPLSKDKFYIGTINNIYETFKDSVTYHFLDKNHVNNNILFIASQNHFPSIRVKDKIYSRLGATNGDLGTNSFYNSKLLLEYNLKNKKIRKLNFSYPYFYYGQCWGPSRDRFSMTLNNKNELIYMFPIKPRIYKYDIINEKIIDSIDVNSKFAASDLKPINCNASSERKMYHTFSNPMFRVIKYDKYKDIYYLFITLPISKEKYKSVKNPFTLNPFSIIVLDKDFNVLTEQKFKGGIYHTSDFFVTEEGLWLSKNSPHNPEFNENELHFSLLTLENVK